MKQFLYLCAAFIAGVIVTAIIFTERSAPSYDPIITTTTVYDTIPDYYPEARDSVVVRYETHRLPIDNTVSDVQDECATTYPDSADVVIPISQTEYADSTYHAWVSGYSVKLDSIYVFPRHDITTIIQPTPKPKRWNIGITAGYGITPKGAQPYIGVGLTYSIFSF